MAVSDERHYVSVFIDGGEAAGLRREYIVRTQMAAREDARRILAVGYESPGDGAFYPAHRIWQVEIESVAAREAREAATHVDPVMNPASES